LGAENSFDLCYILDYIYNELLKLIERNKNLEKENYILREKVKHLISENETIKKEYNELLEKINCSGKEIEIDEIIEQNEKLKEAVKVALEKIDFLLSS
jgi:predicted nuclease with TOPRIM domain